MSPLSKDIGTFTISPETSIKEAMKGIGRNHERILFVTDKNKKLIGSVSDGDIRRALLNGTRFDCPVREIMYKQPRTVQYSHANHRNIAKQIIRKERLHSVPCLNEAGHIVDILFLYDFFEDNLNPTHAPPKYSTPVVIMAGGQGTRLDPFTKILPKPLIPIGDTPIIQKIMDSFLSQGFYQFVATLHYKKEIIKAFFKEYTLDYKIEWTEEPKALGTAGGLQRLKGRFHEPFFVSNCDSLLETDLKKILDWHNSEKAMLTLVGCHKEMVIPYGTLDMKQGTLNQINEKPKLDFIINTGVYVMNPEVINLISENEHLDMNHLIQRVSERGKVTVYPLYEGWFDLGQWNEYRESINLLRTPHEKR